MERRRAHGFTLIELLVVLVVSGILAAASVAGYRQYLRRANRTDATAALLRLQAAEERFYLQNNRYAGEDEREAPPPDGLGMTRTENGYYALAIEPAADGLGVGYVATAVPVGDGPQADDTDCASFFVDQSGRRGARTGGGAEGADITARCWR
jgi:type IV pilus assembly protein PilE